MMRRRCGIAASREVFSDTPCTALGNLGGVCVFGHSLSASGSPKTLPELLQKSGAKFHQDETSETIPEGYARCSSTDFRVFVTVDDLGEGFITPNIIPPQGKISVTLMGDGKTVEVDPHHVTILSIGTKYQHARP